MLPQGSQFKTDKPTPPPMPGVQPPKPPIIGNGGYIGPKTKPAPSPKPLTPGQKSNAKLDEDLNYSLGFMKSVPHGNQGNLNNGWIARGAQHVKDMVSTYDTLMAKVGEKSPRYNEFLAAKARTVAGARRMVERPGEPSGGYAGAFTKETDPKWYAESKKTWDNLNESYRQNRAALMDSPENRRYFANKKKK